MWLKVENFVDKVKAWWATYLFLGNPNFILAKKLAALKLDLKKCNEAEFGNVTFKKQQLWNKLNDLDVREETQLLTAKENLEQVNLHNDIEKLTILGEISWRQKSRVLHLREGDANTRFFLRMANSNRRNNGIESLMVDGILSFDQGMIADCLDLLFLMFVCMMIYTQELPPKRYSFNLLRLRLVQRKMISKYKIFSSENIFQK